MCSHHCSATLCILFLSCWILGCDEHVHLPSPPASSFAHRSSPNVVYLQNNCFYTPICMQYFMLLQDVPFSWNLGILHPKSSWIPISHDSDGVLLLGSFLCCWFKVDMQFGGCWIDSNTELQSQSWISPAVWKPDKTNWISCLEIWRFPLHRAPELSAMGRPLVLLLWEVEYLNLPMLKGKIPFSRDQWDSVYSVHIMQSCLLSPSKQM